MTPHFSYCFVTLCYVFINLFKNQPEDSEQHNDYNSIINDAYKHIQSIYYEAATVLGHISFNCDHSECQFKGEEFEA